MKVYKWFGYCPESGFEVFDSEEKARKYAEDSLGWFRGEAGDGWDEQVDQICWGEIKQDVKMSLKQPWDESEAGEDREGEFDYYAEYSLVDVDKTFKLD